MYTRLFPAALFAALSVAQAHAAEEPAGYLVSAQDGAPVTTASGACVRTSEWNPAASYRDCNREIQAVVPAKAGIPFISAAAETVSSDSPLRAEPIRISMNTLFDFDSAVLRADAGPALDALAKQLTQSNYQKVDIVGHADRMGPGKYNQQLSEQRAEAVRDHLLARGLDATKLTAFGVGATEPLTGKECRGLRGKPLVYCLQRDRYTEITVLGSQTSAMR
jgi:OmpA-OmpF porin, OOP family